jgi:hypothetical protein
MPCRISIPIAVLALFAWQGGVAAQAPAARGEQAQCPVSLAHAAGTFKRCSPQTAAAYDFAFCSVYSRTATGSAQESGQALRQRGMEYGNVSVALSDVETYRKNADLAKRWFVSLPAGPRKEAAIAGVRTKCGVIEAWHATTLNELSTRVKSRAEGNR